MAKTLDEAGVKRLIQEIKGANKNLNTPIPISTENTPESMAQNVKNIADYIEKAKAAGIANVNGMAVTCSIDEGYSGVGSIGCLPGNIEISICGIITYDGNPLENPTFFAVDPDGTYRENNVLIEHSRDIITPDMLVEGARKPIILTPSTTEVDEETYQKLLSDDVDVVYNTINMTTKDIDSDKNITMTFSYAICTADIMQIASIDIQISSTSPHLVVKGDQAAQIISPEQVVNKSTLSPLLQEIDLTGTDVDRKAKLDQFANEWRALTGADYLTGARFVGNFGIPGDDITRNVTGIMTYCVGDDTNETNDNCFYGICNGYSFSKQKSQIAVKVSCKDGSLTITPLFSRLEAITIKTGNTPDAKAANVAAIKAYVDNLKALGVDVTKGWTAPVKVYATNGISCGMISNTGEDSAVSYTMLYGLNGEYPYVNYVNKTTGATGATGILTAGKYSNLTTTANQIIPAINEVDALAKSKQDKLTSGTNIKTVNGQSLLGSGDVTVGDVEKNGDNTFTGTNTFAKETAFNDGITCSGPTNDITIRSLFENDGSSNQLALQFLKRKTGSSPVPVIVKGVATPLKDDNAANKKYVDDKVAAAGGGSAPVLVDIDDITGSAGVSVPVDVFNKIANAASAKTPIFGYSKLVEGPRTTYEIIPLYVKNVSTTDTNGSLSIQFIAENAYNSIGIVKRSDTECSILISSSRTFALDTSVDKSSTRGIQSSAVWKEIHSEPMTVNTATSEITTLSSTGKHKILCYADSGTQQYNLPPSPVDGETFLFLKVKSGHTITIHISAGNQKIYDCSSGNSVVSKTIESSTKSKITVTYSSTVGKWFLMADDFIS